MNEGIKKVCITLLRYLAVFALGCAAAGVWAHIRELEQIRGFNERIARIDSGYTERQRELESRLGESGRIIEEARGVVGRTGESLQSVSGNIGEAIRIIRETYQQIQEIDRILNRGPSPGGGGGDTGGVADE
jgi:hypothetical protein